MQPAMPDEKLFTVTTANDDGSFTLHVPRYREELDLRYKGIDLNRSYRTGCDTVGECALYAADEYVLDADWCPDCIKVVEKNREMLVIFKTTNLADALKGVRVNVPTTIVPSNRPFSKSKDLLYDPRPRRRRSSNKRRRPQPPLFS